MAKTLQFLIISRHAFPKFAMLAQASADDPHVRLIRDRRYDQRRRRSSSHAEERRDRERRNDRPKASDHHDRVLQVAESADLGTPHPGAIAEPMAAPTSMLVVNDDIGLRAAVSVSTVERRLASAGLAAAKTGIEDRSAMAADRGQGAHTPTSLRICATNPVTTQQPTLATSDAIHRASPSLAGGQRILLLVPDLSTPPPLHTILRDHGYLVECAATCAAAVQALADLKPALIITDLALPDQSGPQLYDLLRRCSQAAIMIVTNSESEETCAQALHAGADDYVVKRRPTEFAARVAALLRRVKDPNDELVTAGDITIDLQTRDVWVRGRRARLRPHEFDLLCDLARHPSMVRSYRTLLAAVWGSSIRLRSHYVRMCVAHLRRQIEPTPEHPQYILTERSVGYRLEPHGEQAQRTAPPRLLAEPG